MEDYGFIFILIGIIFALIEIFLIPGLGLAGLVSFIFLILGTYFIGSKYGGLIAVLSFTGSIVVIGLAFVAFFRSPASKWVVMGSKFRSQDERHENLLDVGMKGMTLTPLFPTGKATFVIEGREKNLDVSSQGDFIDQGKEVLVERVEGNRIFVSLMSSNS